jgi:two-component system sensor histidine kinase/response regulator
MSARDNLEGLEAIKHADEVGQPFSCVILDWSMSGMSGLEAAKRIKQELPLLQRPKVIYLSGHKHTKMINVSAAAQLLDAVIDKPVTPSGLLDAIMTCIFDQCRLPPPALPDEPQANLSGLRVLLVEDNKFNQQLSGALLARSGVQVSIADDGFEALQALQRESFDAVLMDMQMPKMDGLEATRQIRKIPALATLPVIAMTANAMIGDREICLAAGMNDYLSKPLHYQTMNATLARWTHRNTPPNADAATGIRHANDTPSVLDADSAMARMGGKKLYLSMLGKFLPSQGQAVQSIQDALANDDRTTAERLAHTLKGVAASVGAISLEESASRLEQAIRAGDAEVYPQLVEAAARELHQAGAAINSYLQQQRQDESPPVS